MQDLGKEPRPEYLKTETECARAGSNQAQASNLHRGDVGATDGAGRVSIRLPRSKGECSYASEDARPSRGAIACAHANDSREPAAHSHGPKDSAQDVEGVEESAPVPHRASRDERLSKRGECGTETECGW